MVSKVKVGIFNDMGDGFDVFGDIIDWLMCEIMVVQVVGWFDVEVEFVYVYGFGLFLGIEVVVECVFMELVWQEVVMIIGLVIGDNVLVVMFWVECECILMINWVGVECVCGEWMFYYQVGLYEDELLVMVWYMKVLGVDRIGVVFDQLLIGMWYLQYFEDEVWVIGLEIVVMVDVLLLIEDVLEEVVCVLVVWLQGFVYFGFGFLVFVVV